MKTLRNFKVSGYIVAGQDRTPAAPNDRITLFLDRVYDPTFPVSIVGTIVGVTPVNCGDDTSYDIRYNEADLTGGHPIFGLRMWWIMTSLLRLMFCGVSFL